MRGPTPVPGPAPAAATGSVDETQARKRRKQEGAVYTPAFITRYIVGQALGGVLKQRFEALRRQHESETSGTARKALADPNAYDLTALNEPQRKALIRFWEAWQEALKRLRILDLACGSGYPNLSTGQCSWKNHSLRAPSRFVFSRRASTRGVKSIVNTTPSAPLIMPSKISRSFSARVASTAFTNPRKSSFASDVGLMRRTCQP